MNIGSINLQRTLGDGLQTYIYIRNLKSNSWNKIKKRKYTQNLLEIVTSKGESNKTNQILWCNP